jgi:hypothetical protein
VWISTNLYIQIVVVLWPRLKFSFLQTFEYPDNNSGMKLSLKLKENAEQVSRAVHVYIDHCLSQLTQI